MLITLVEPTVVVVVVVSGLIVVGGLVGRVGAGFVVNCSVVVSADGWSVVVTTSTMPWVGVGSATVLVVRSATVVVVMSATEVVVVRSATVVVVRSAPVVVGRSAMAMVVVRSSIVVVSPVPRMGYFCI